ncbi:LamG domain-containing protein [Oceanicoccus sp. KOV_DT_Chl]|uniref:LamG domain-containing protein n=1 Tax=Oceanicoccus sp. KOV_DT_Chl TaxID=1904639 RepID=UPI00135A00EE|nr:LamG domain-containing protein [Oceanicoccus sp. KOV_DT_Chl]
MKKIISMLSPYWKIAFLTSAMFLIACSGGSGGGGSDRVADISGGSGDGTFVYNGASPQSDEVQSFKIAFYDNLVIEERCGRCHTPGGEAGSIDFVNRDDVNLAWQAAKLRVNLVEPSSSAIVTKVAGGHQCWLGSDKAATCAVTLTGYIEAWASGASQGVSLVSLSPRTIYSPDAEIKFFPPDLVDAQDLGAPIDDLMTLTRTYCSNCHNEAVAVPQAPYFASSDDDIAYAALKTKVDLNNPAQSRLVLRLADDQHQCWSDCESDAATMNTAIQNFAALVAVSGVDDNLAFSMAQTLSGDGIAAASGGRYETDIIAKWEFREGSGVTVADTSGTRPEIELTLSGEVTWLGGGGVRFDGGKAQGGVGSSEKLANLISTTGEYSIEAWVAPYNVTQEDAWMIGYSGGVNNRNFLAAQNLYAYDFYNRGSVNDDNGAGEPLVTTENDAVDFAQAALQHVVMTYDPIAGRKIYVNGVDTGAVDDVGGGLINSWNTSFALTLGNSVGFDRPWLGAMRMVAVHNRKLTVEQINLNFEAGVGTSYYLLFSVADLVDEPNCRVTTVDAASSDYCYVGFNVSEYDEFSYLFKTPFFVNLNPSDNSINFNLEGIRLGINSKLANVGQAFLNISDSISDNNFTEIDPQLVNNGQLLSPIGTIIALESGPDQDVFFLAFDEIGSNTSVVSDGADNSGSFSYSLVGVESPDLAMKTFDEINKTYAEITGVSSSRSEPAGAAFYNLKLQLPSVADFKTFSSSHVMAATQLAAAYCDELVADVALRESFFPGFFAAGSAPLDAEAVADSSWNDDVVAPLVNKGMNTGVFDAAGRTKIEGEVKNLIDLLRDCGGTCASDKTYEVVKGACIATLTSGAVMVD